MKTDLSAFWLVILGCALAGALVGGCALSSGIDLPSTDRDHTGSASDGAESPGVGAGEDDGAGGDCGAGGAGGAAGDSANDDCP